MKYYARASNARDYIAELASKGRYCFTSDEARKQLGGSSASVKLALNRLAHRGLIASPARGFYVVIPPEYASLGCLPPDQFIPDLMARYKQPYYVGLLSAAQYHGAAHQRPQAFQVMLERARRSIHCGKVRVIFAVRKRLAEVPTQRFNTPRGSLEVATPEATAVDLVGYPHHAGGLDNVATLLAELAEFLDPDNLVEAAETAPVTWAQRLGYLLELVGRADQAQALRTYVARTAHDTVALLPGASREDARVNRDWKLVINTTVEPEL